MIKYIKKLSIIKFNLLLFQDVRQLIKCQFLYIDTIYMYGKNFILIITRKRKYFN